jgi:hypothetical protein
VLVDEELHHWLLMDVEKLKRVRGGGGGAHRCAVFSLVKTGLEFVSCAFLKPQHIIRSNN